MPDVLERPDLPPFPRKKFTAEEVESLARSGHLSAKHVELIAGDIVPKMPNNPPHAIFAQWVYLALVALFGRDYVLANFTLRIDAWNAPDPDVAVTTRNIFEFLHLGKPQPEEIRLLVDVSDETLSYDLTTKAVLYARASIPEYWVVSVPKRVLIVHREPAPAGYQSVIEYNSTDALEPLAAPGQTLSVADLMP
ncbi:MAG: Uma2 family endonuclease [Armatimonadaceae bacterium]